MSISSVPPARGDYEVVPPIPPTTRLPRVNSHEFSGMCHYKPLDKLWEGYSNNDWARREKLSVLQKQYDRLLGIYDRIVADLPIWLIRQQGLVMVAPSNTIEEAHLLSLQEGVRRRAGEILNADWEGLKTHALNSLSLGDSSKVEAGVVWQRVAATLMEVIKTDLSPEEVRLLQAEVRRRIETAGSPYLELIGMLEMSCKAPEGYPNWQYQVNLQDNNDLRVLRADIIARVTGMGYNHRQRYFREVQQTLPALSTKLRLMQRYEDIFPHPDTFGNLRDTMWIALKSALQDKENVSTNTGSAQDQGRLARWRKYTNMFDMDAQKKMGLKTELSPRSILNLIDDALSRAFRIDQDHTPRRFSISVKLCGLLSVLEDFRDKNMLAEASIICTALEDVLEAYHHFYSNAGEKHKYDQLFYALDNVLMVARHKLSGAGNTYSNE